MTWLKKRIRKWLGIVEDFEELQRLLVALENRVGACQLVHQRRSKKAAR
jgi:hypothetical protein